MQHPSERSVLVVGAVCVSATVVHSGLFSVLSELVSICGSTDDADEAAKPCQKDRSYKY